MGMSLRCAGSARKKVTISFNLENKQDLKRLEFIKTVDFSNWVKQQIDIEIEQKIIREDMKK